MIKTEIKNIPLMFETEPTVFSPNAIDNGTLAMLSLIDFSKDDKVLDLGCGYGVVGILAGKIIGEQNVVMCDISETAVQLAKRNAVSYRFFGCKALYRKGVQKVKNRRTDGNGHKTSCVV